MSTSFKTSMFGGFDRSDVIAYIERTGREYEERVAALEAENETLRKENQTLENTQRVTQAQLLKMQDNEETCRRLRRQLADAEARNQELEQRCAQLKVQADEYESLKDHVAQIEIPAATYTETPIEPEEGADESGDTNRQTVERTKNPLDMAEVKLILWSIE